MIGRRQRLHRKAAMGVALVLLMAAGTAAAPPRAARLVVAYGISPVTMDPQMHSNTVTESVLRNIFETLVVRSDDMKALEPGLATSWQQVDETTWQFKLRRGVRFHNGEAFNAAAVKFSIDRVLDPRQRVPLRTLVEPIQRVEVVDDFTINVVTRRPDPLLVGRFGGYATNIVPPGYVREKGDAFVAVNPVGTGPYRFASWVRDGDLILETNPDYWGPPPKFGTVIIKPIPESATRVAALRTGEADIIVNVPPPDIPAIRRSGRAEIHTIPSGRIMHAILNAQEGPTANVKVRQALNHAVDVDSIIATILGGYGRRIATVVAAEDFGHDPNLKPYPYDLAKARQLLAEAGYPNGFDITFDCPKGRYPFDSEVCQALAGQLEQAGVRARVVFNEWALYNSKSAARTLGALSLWGWGTLNFDADGRLRSLFATVPAYPRGTARQTYSNKDFDALVLQAIETTNPATRLRLYKMAQRILYHDAANLFLYQLVDIYGVSTRITWKPRADEMVWASRAAPR